MSAPLFDRTGLAEEISDLIDRSETGEVRIRWSTTDGDRVVEVVRSGTWPRTQQADQTRIWSDRSAVRSQTKVPRKVRAAQRAADTEKVLGLIETFGIDSVGLDQVRALLKIQKTSAYHRLTEAREIWRTRS